MDSFGTFTALDSVDSQLQGTQCTQADPTMSYSFDVAMFDPIWTLYPILESSHTPPFESPLLSSSSSSSFSDYETSTVDPYTSSSAGLSNLNAHLDNALELAGPSHWDASPHYTPRSPFQSDNFPSAAPTPEAWHSPAASSTGSPLPLTPEPLSVPPASLSPSCASVSVPPESPSSEWDVDAEGETDSEYEPETSSDAAASDIDGDDDDDYAPSPSPAHRSTSTKSRPTSRPSASRSSKQTRRFSPYETSSRSRAPSATPSSSSDSSTETAALRYISARCAQVSMPLEALPELQPGAAMVCPVCNYVQHGVRRSEYNRHVKTHFRDALHAEHACWGVRVADAAAYGITDLSDARMFNGELRVGGCWKGFSRRDAVLRHLKNKNNKCVCDVVPDKVRRHRH